MKNQLFFMKSELELEGAEPAVTPASGVGPRAQAQTESERSSSSGGGGSGGGIVEKFDESRMRPYFVDTRTGKTAWTREELLTT